MTQISKLKNNFDVEEMEISFLDKIESIYKCMLYPDFASNMSRITGFCYGK